MYVIGKFMYSHVNIEQNQNPIISTSNRIPTRGQYQKVSHVYFLLQVFRVILLFHQVVLLSDINVVLMSQ